MTTLANNGHDAQFFKQQFLNLAERIKVMPKTYEQDGKGDEAIVYLHYVLGRSHWFITEKDRDGGIEQAFGYAVINGDVEMAEWSYISILEITDLGAELDLRFVPCKLAKIKVLLR